PLLRDANNFVRLGVLHFRSWRKSFDVHVFAGRKRTFDEMRLARNRDSVWIISLRYFRGRSRWNRRSRPRLPGRSLRLNGSIRVERLLLRRVFFGLRWRVIRDAMRGALRRRLFTAWRKKEGDEKGKQQ